MNLTIFLKSYHGKTGYYARKYLMFADGYALRVTLNDSKGIKVVVKNVNRETNEHFSPSRIATMWNGLPENIKLALKPVSGSSLMKQSVNPYYYFLLETPFDPDNTCTSLNHCLCLRCRVL